MQWSWSLLVYLPFYMYYKSLARTSLTNIQWISALKAQDEMTYFCSANDFINWLQNIPCKKLHLYVHNY